MLRSSWSLVRRSWSSMRWAMPLALSVLAVGACGPGRASGEDSGQPLPADATTPDAGDAPSPPECPSLPLAPGSVVSGSTADAGAGAASGAAVFAAACGGDQTAFYGAEVVYRYAPVAPGAFAVKVTPSADYDVGVWVSTEVCRDPAHCTGTADHAGPGGDEVVVVNGPPAAVYWIVVSAADAQQAGDFTIEVTALTAPGNDRCPGIDVTGRVGEQVAGSTLGAANDYGSYLSTACDPSQYLSLAGGDVVYSYTPTADGVFRATVTPVDAFDPALWVVESTCDAGGSACTRLADGAGTGAESVLVHGVAGTTYFLVVDSYSSDQAGDFTITVEPIPTPANAACPGAELTLDTPVAGTTMGSASSQGAGPFAAACPTPGPLRGEDVIYRYAPAQSGRFTVAVTATTQGFAPYLWMTRGTCGGAGGACVAIAHHDWGATASLVVDGLAGTTYYFVVDALLPGYGGGFTIVVAGAPDNDRCPGQSLDALGVAVPGTTIGAASDYPVAVFPAACDPSPGFGGMSGPDAVYSYTPAADGPLTVTVTPQDGFDVAVWATAGTCGGDGTGCLAYADAAAGGDPETITLAGVAGTTYFFVVGPVPYSPDMGRFTIQVD